jgi:hypothetical protein
MPSQAVVHAVPAELLGHEHTDPRATRDPRGRLVKRTVDFVAVHEHRDRLPAGGGRPGDVVGARWGL